MVAWAVDRKIGTLVVGDPKGITDLDLGAAHNLRLRQWRRTHLMPAAVATAGTSGDDGVGSAWLRAAHRPLRAGSRSPQQRELWKPSHHT